MRIKELIIEIGKKVRLSMEEATIPPYVLLAGLLVVVIVVALRTVV